MRCEAITRGGERCSRAASWDDERQLCRQHSWTPEERKEAYGHPATRGRAYDRLVRSLGFSLATDSMVVERRARDLSLYGPVAVGGDFKVPLADGRRVNVRIVPTGQGGGGLRASVLTHVPDAFRAYSWAGTVARDEKGLPWSVVLNGRSMLCAGFFGGVQLVVERWHQGVGFFCEPCRSLPSAAGLVIHGDSGLLASATCDGCGESPLTVGWMVPELRTEAVE
tara:strand:+ start:365 stop:1036 length:672 start_codon:yes stop_codon:yes gene_type:complete